MSTPLNPLPTLTEMDSYLDEGIYLISHAEERLLQLEGEGEGDDASQGHLLMGAQILKAMRRILRLIQQRRNTLEIEIALHPVAPLVPEKRPWWSYWGYHGPQPRDLARGPSALASAPRLMPPQASFPQTRARPRNSHNSRLSLRVRGIMGSGTSRGRWDERSRAPREFRPTGIVAGLRRGLLGIDRVSPRLRLNAAFYACQRKQTWPSPIDREQLYAAFTLQIKIS
jgi:hypothetical protein